MSGSHNFFVEIMNAVCLNLVQTSVIFVHNKAVTFCHEKTIDPGLGLNNLVKKFSLLASFSLTRLVYEQNDLVEFPLSSSWIIVFYTVLFRPRTRHKRNATSLSCFN